MKGYAFAFNGQAFTPEGKAEIPDPDAHNRALEASELEHWATCPDRFHCYVTTGRPTVSTWLGAPLGNIIRSTSYRNNLGAAIRHVTIRGTNGACYHGSFGPDWSQFCRIRKMKGA
jgi:hypothetical protein